MSEVILPNEFDGSGMIRDPHKLFYGPDAPFQRYVCDAKYRGVMVKNLDRIRERLPNIDDKTWKILEQLALVHSAHAYEYDIEACLSALKAIEVDKNGSFEPEYVEFEQIKLTSNRYSLNKEKWGPQHWAFIDTFAETCGDKPPTYQERTPIILADTQEAYVLHLVAELVPGPTGLISPMWWKIGLIPIRGENGLMASVHKGFKTITDAYYQKRYRIRWWLENPNHQFWPKDIEECPSFETSAACLALALLERTDDWPLLDDNVAASACLTDTHHKNNHVLSDFLVGKVGHVKTKVERGAVPTELSGVVFSKSHEKDFEDRDRESSPILQFVLTLAEAYDSLLITSAADKESKGKVCAKWEEEWGPEPYDTPEIYRSKSAKNST